MKAFQFVLFMLLFLCAIAKHSKAQNDDLRLRTGIKLEKEVTKRLEFGFETQLRMNYNWSEFDKYIIEPALKYEWRNNWRMLTAYRYSWDQNKANYRMGKHRTSLFIGRKSKINADWDLKYKSGIEYEFRSFGRNYNPKYRNWTNRNELMLAYDLFGTPLSAEIGSELFLNLSNYALFNQVRLASEINYKLTKNAKLSVQYLLDFKLQAYGSKNHIVGFMYQLKI